MNRVVLRSFGEFEREGLGMGLVCFYFLSPPDGNIFKEMELGSCFVS